jgi:hypothetical protein
VLCEELLESFQSTVCEGERLFFAGVIGPSSGSI